MSYRRFCNKKNCSEIFATNNSREKKINEEGGNAWSLASTSCTSCQNFMENGLKLGSETAFFYREPCWLAFRVQQSQPDLWRSLQAFSFSCSPVRTLLPDALEISSACYLGHYAPTVRRQSCTITTCAAPRWGSGTTDCNRKQPFLFLIPPHMSVSTLYTLQQTTVWYFVWWEPVRSQCYMDSKKHGHLRIATMCHGGCNSWYIVS